MGRREGAVLCEDGGWSGICANTNVPTVWRSCSFRTWMMMGRSKELDWAALAQEGKGRGRGEEGMSTTRGWGSSRNLPLSLVAMSDSWVSFIRFWLVEMASSLEGGRKTAQLGRVPTEGGQGGRQTAAWCRPRKKAPAGSRPACPPQRVASGPGRGKRGVCVRRWGQQHRRQHHQAHNLGERDKVVDPGDGHKLGQLVCGWGKAADCARSA